MVTSLLLIFLIFLIWAYGALVIHQAHKQRMAIIEHVYHEPGSEEYRPDCLERAKLFQQVSYNRHLLYAATFRDPIQLYDPSIRP